jgi:hypothetical protein
MDHSIQLHFIDYLLLVTYFSFVIGIGVVIKRNVSGSKDFFESGHSLPSGVCALGFIGANLGAQEVMGMAASGAKYGIMTSHFYWVGAIPAMVFVAVFMMPFYYGSKARSVCAALARDQHQPYLGCSATTVWRRDGGFCVTRQSQRDACPQQAGITLMSLSCMSRRQPPQGRIL